MMLFFAPILQGFHLGLCIGREFIDRYDIRKSEGFDRFNVLRKIGTARKHSLCIFIL